MQSHSSRLPVLPWFSAAIASVALTLSLSAGAMAQTIIPVIPSEAAESPAPQEIDTSVSRDYEPAVVYLPDPQTQQLVPQSVLLDADEPVVGAVDQIMQSYEGENPGIEGYEVSVNQTAHQAEINFNVDHPRGGRALQSLSSANQFALFEAIRETLLTQPVYSIDQVIFLTNGVSVDI
ncbi:hypothetical protein H6G89_01745 [Oscillatoria sp. FACHB-1407]|uniref:hypothetical protein n=1 Tax=Oscillatoria sp. FACHB-1407 TaxID=2692847 RepID=UPI0016866054|nr:hypothetical protein [Oscillatoria sp. FACHB-1407]MBD2459755.1 hypothetical protein [Oscillatoria sp. FACHB-1407]